MTTNDLDSTTSYLRDIHRFSLVTAKEEIELANRVKKGDETAKERLITANLRLVVKIAHTYKGLGIPIQDLIAEGNIGLIRAVEKFLPSKGLRFSTYATWWIKQAIRCAFTDKKQTIRIPASAALQLKKIQAVRSQLKEKLGRDPNDEEVSTTSGFSVGKISRLKYSGREITSLDIPIFGEKENGLMELLEDERSLAPDDTLDFKDSIEWLNRLISKLSPREQLVLSMRFGLGDESPKSFREIGNRIGRTSERVRQIQNIALDKLHSLFKKCHNTSSIELLSKNLQN